MQWNGRWPSRPMIRSQGDRYGRKDQFLPSQWPIKSSDGNFLNELMKICPLNSSIQLSNTWACASAKRGVRSWHFSNFVGYVTCTYSQDSLTFARLTHQVNFNHYKQASIPVLSKPFMNQFNALLNPPQGPRGKAWGQVATRARGMRRRHFLHFDVGFEQQVLA